MMHYTCDGCGKVLSSELGERIELRMEFTATAAPLELVDTDLEQDNLDAVAELLRDLEEDSSDPDSESTYRRLRFDLCTHCARRLQRNPLGRAEVPNLRFSEN